jgi:hypothetical protein
MPKGAAAMAQQQLHIWLARPGGGNFRRQPGHDILAHRFHSGLVSQERAA